MNRALDEFPFLSRAYIFGAESKGQLISKCLFGIFNSPKKTNKNIRLYYNAMVVPQVELFSFVFWKNLKTIKRDFEINWPLVLRIVSHLWNWFFGMFQKTGFLNKRDKCSTIPSRGHSMNMWAKTYLRVDNHRYFT